MQSPYPCTCSGSTITSSCMLPSTHNVTRNGFALPGTQYRFGLPVGKQVFMYAR